MAPPKHSGSNGRFWWMILFLFLLQNTEPGETKSIVTKNGSDSKSDKLLYEDTELIHNNYTATEPCSATCGLGIREIYLTHGCPDNKPRCLTGYEECKAKTDCGFGYIPETKDVVAMTCNTIIPENRFTFVWKIVAEDQQPQLLPNKKSILQVYRGLNTLIYQCETYENNQLIASIKYMVVPNSELTKDFYSGALVGIFMVTMTLVILSLAVICMICVRVYKIHYHNEADIESRGEVQQGPASTTIELFEDTSTTPASAEPLQHEKSIGQTATQPLQDASTMLDAT